MITPSSSDTRNVSDPLVNLEGVQGLTVSVAPHVVPVDAATQDAHDDEEEDVGADPLVDAEGVEGLAVGVAPHAVRVDALTHVPDRNVVIVPAPIPDPRPWSGP